MFSGFSDNWRWMLGLAALPGLPLAVGMLFVPHTPRWLVQAGRDDEAREVLRRVRSGDEVDEEIGQIKEVVEQHRGASLRRLFGSRMRQLLFVGLALAIFQLLIGVNTVIYYSATILKYTGISNTRSIGEALFVGITTVVFTIVAILLLDRVGRRVLLLIGTVGAGLALGLLGAFFQSPTMRHDASFLISYFFLRLVAGIGMPGTFWLYAGFGMLAVIVFALRVPETRDRSLEDVERQLGSGRRERANAA